MNSDQEAMRDADRDQAAARLAGYLRAGELSLLLGAGVSTGLGLPSWDELVEACEDAVGLSPDLGEGVMRRMDGVRRQVGGSEEFAELVRTQLYFSLGATNQYPDHLLQSRMLIALGALVMSSVRGSVTDVLTLNFDDVLDWYLHLHGFKTQVVTHLPLLVSGRTDVRILHLHGFLPLMPRFDRTDWLVLTHDQLIDRLSDHTAPWPVAISAFIQSKILLVVGTSMQDVDLDVLIRRVHVLVGASRPLGFVLVKGISDSRAAALKEWGMEPVVFDEFDQIPDFILDVCQRAASDRPHLSSLKPM